MLRLFRNLAQDNAGNVLAIFAAALIPLTIVIGSGLDLSFAYMAKSKLQNACDAAVLAGRQSMSGTSWTTANEAEAQKFFDFNFPSGTLGTEDLEFDVEQDPDDDGQILGSASATVPTSLMFIFGYDEINVVASCDATRDLGHNDVMVVLDVTGSMNDSPSIGGATKIARLREGALGLFRALNDTTNGSITRFGIMPYSHTVNVGRSLKNRDIIKDQLYAYGTWTYKYCDSNGYAYWNCVNRTSDDQPTFGLSNGNTKYTYSINFVYSGEHYVDINRSTWNLGSGGTTGGNRQAFRTSGDACIEERSTIGNDDNPISIEDYVTASDVDDLAQNGNDKERQFGRYDPAIQEGESQDGCPSEATKLQQYDSESAFETAINNATARVTGGTYHDIGMLWAARFISRTGFFADENPTEIDDIPVNQHIVFMTDGDLDTGATLYSAYGIDRYQDRVNGSGNQNDKHISRYDSVCDLVKSRGVTVWVIVLDEENVDDIEGCATSEAHYYFSDGSNLESIFENIGRGIGNLRLTK